jgi:hypothetical protein
LPGIVIYKKYNRRAEKIRWSLKRKEEYADELMRDHQVVTPKKGGIKSRRAERSGGHSK